ncbi:MAG: hypothetical protein M0C28_20095 [Candidatus Moduliflexus flocculans]|nr:hypothetical protein [Candidatus Moduliflexus flocculans]
MSYFIRTNLGIPAIFTYAATGLRPDRAAGHAVRLPRAAVRQRRHQGRPGRSRSGRSARPWPGIFVVLKNVKFVFLILVLAMFWFLYIQLYNLMPLFMRYVDPERPDGALHPGQSRS